MNEGSSVNVFICNKKNIIKKLKLLQDYKKILIEEFIPGREIQAAIIGSIKLGAIELKPKRKFYDYQAKYNHNAKTEHIIPVDLKKKDFNKLMNISLKAHRLIGCCDTNLTLNFLENFIFKLILSGNDNLSLVQITAHKGINFVKLIEMILNDASTKK